MSVICHILINGSASTDLISWMIGLLRAGKQQRTVGQKVNRRRKMKT
jgi:hypothetical protein